MNKPLLSVVTVTYRDLAGLRRTADSLPTPLPPGVEWLVIDGGSGPEVVDVLQDDPRCRYVSEPDNGIYDAMNKGTRLAAGDFVLYMNGGDVLASQAVLPQLLPHLRRARDEAPATVFAGGSMYVLDNGRRLRRPARGRWYLAHGMPALHQSLVFPRKALGERPYPEGFSVCADYHVTANVLQGGARLRRLDVAVSEFRLGGHSYQHPVRLVREAAMVQRNVLKLSRPLICLSAAVRTFAAVRLRLWNVLARDNEGKIRAG